MSIEENLNSVKESLRSGVTLVAVSKTKPVEYLQKAYSAGQRIFGENKVQEMCEKYEVLPKDIKWHMIGHLQRNKVKYIAGFVDLIHGVDNLKLLKEIDKQALRHNRIINCLLQIKIAEEDSKFGLSKIEALQLMQSADFKNLKNISIQGVMGMATFTNEEDRVRDEFKSLKQISDEFKAEFAKYNDQNSIISMGMSGDYKIAIEEGSNMVRVGSSIFGSRNHQ